MRTDFRKTDTYYSFNRYIVECKFSIKSILLYRIIKVLIDT